MMTNANNIEISEYFFFFYMIVKQKLTLVLCTKILILSYPDDRFNVFITHVFLCIFLTIDRN